MPLIEIMRFLREKATTPSRVIGVLSFYLTFAVYEGSGLYQPFLAAHAELLQPLAGFGIVYFVLLECWGWLSSTGNLPATQKQVFEMRGAVSTIDKRQMRLADTIGEAYWESDETGRMIFSNYANARLYGTTARELIRSGTAPYIHKGDVDDAYRQFHQAIQGRMGFSIEFDVVDRGVVQHTVRTYAWPLFDEDDKFIGHYGSAEIVQEFGEEEFGDGHY